MRIALLFVVLGLNRRFRTGGAARPLLSKPLVREYKAPMKPARAWPTSRRSTKHATWREPVIDDTTRSRSSCPEPVGTKHERRMYPDSAAVVRGARR